MVCNSNCGDFVDGERPYCVSSGLSVSEGMRCIEGKSGRKERYIPIEDIGKLDSSKPKRKK